MNKNPETKTIMIDEIMRMIPHRYPFLMIDRLIDVVSGETATGIKNVSYNEPYFQGHFPKQPIMPGVMIIEAMAQTAGVIVLDSIGKTAINKAVYLMSVDEARFRKPVVPGDTLYIYALRVKNRQNIWRFQTKCLVNEQCVAEAVITAMLNDFDEAV